jgi:hypothetical protein
MRSVPDQDKPSAMREYAVTLLPLLMSVSRKAASENVGGACFNRAVKRRPQTRCTNTRQVESGHDSRPTNGISYWQRTEFIDQSQSPASMRPIPRFIRACKFRQPNIAMYSQQKTPALAHPRIPAARPAFRGILQQQQEWNRVYHQAQRGVLRVFPLVPLMFRAEALAPST